MPTVGLQGIWGMEHLDRLTIPAWQLSVLLIGGGMLVGALLALLVGNVNDNSVFAGYWTSELITGTLILDGLLIGSSAFNNLVLARTTEADLRLLTKLDTVVAESIEKLRPSAGVFLPFIIWMVLSIMVVPLLMAAMELGLEISSLPQAIFASGIPGVFLVLIAAPLVGIGFGIGFAQFYLQPRVLVDIARRIRVDLLDLDRYCAIANPGVRLAIMFICVGSLFPLIFLSIDVEQAETRLLQGGAVFAVVVLGVLSAYFYPALVLRNRIRDKKLAELDALRQAMMGNDDAIMNLSIQHRGLPSSTQEFLMHQMFVESRWEWPIAGHLQRLALFGLLPPATWVFAALIENLIF